MKRASALMMLIALCGLAMSTAGAAIIDIPCDGADKTYRDDGSSIWVGQKNAGVGMDSSARELGHVLVFELPDLGGETIQSANLLMHAWDSAWGTSLSLDLYALRRDASNATAASDMYRGPWDTSSGLRTPIMQAYAVKVAGNPAPPSERNVETDAAGDTALAAWLAGEYAAGAQAGEFVFLLVTPDTDYVGGSNSYIYFDTGDTTTVQSYGATYVQNPLLTITTIPEPATMALLAVGVFGALRRKR